MRNAIIAAAIVILAWIASGQQVRGGQPPSAVPDSGGPLSSTDLVIPVLGVERSQLHDNFNEGRVGHTHDALDIMAAQGTPVIAAVDGTIRKLFLSKPGGNTIYEFDPSEHYCYYYAHLDRYAEGLKEGMKVHRGEVIAYVGSTGDAGPNNPHLHFAIAAIGPDKKWWGGTPINPYPILRASLLGRH